MAVSTTSSPELSSTDAPAAELSPDKQRLRGQRIVFVGRLIGMPRREACQVVMRHGGEVLSGEIATATLVVLGDEEPGFEQATAGDLSIRQLLQENINADRAQLIRESELWQLLGLVGSSDDQCQGVKRLYTPAMLAELLQAPVAMIRRWHRQEVLVACRSVRRLPYFDFAEVAVARHLVSLTKAGCSLRVIDRKLAELSRLIPDAVRPLADPSIIVSGRCLYLRRGEDLSEPGGQLLLDFDKPSAEDSEEGCDGNASDSPPQPLLSISHHFESLGMGIDTSATEALSTVAQMQQEAADLEEAGDLPRAVEMYRTMLVAEGPTAETHFALADLLYRMGDYSAARERYYAAIELDEQYVEARANLGCVLAENGELELALAAFEGALAMHPDYADVHYHLANVLERLECPEQAESHWVRFLGLAPESPWADMARERLGKRGSEVCLSSDTL